MNLPCSQFHRPMTSSSWRVIFDSINQLMNLARVNYWVNKNDNVYSQKFLYAYSDIPLENMNLQQKATVLSNNVDLRITLTYSCFKNSFELESVLFKMVYRLWTWSYMIIWLKLHYSCFRYPLKYLKVVLIWRCKDDNSDVLLGSEVVFQCIGCTPTRVIV